jgi:hypothetical protein
MGRAAPLKWNSSHAAITLAMARPAAAGSAAVPTSNTAVRSSKKRHDSETFTIVHDLTSNGLVNAAFDQGC